MLCRKHDLKCMAACGECSCESCGNSADIIEEKYDEDKFEMHLLDFFLLTFNCRYLPVQSLL